MPYFRRRNPIPPPSVMPPMPTEAVSPNPVARPCAPAAFVYSPAVSPASAQADAVVHIDVQRLHRREVEDDPAVGDAESRTAVAAASDGQLAARVARERRPRRRPPGVDGPDDRPPAAGRCCRGTPPAHRRSRRSSGAITSPRSSSRSSEIGMVPGRASESASEPPRVRGAFLSTTDLREMATRRIRHRRFPLS